jgi:transcriptional regulator with XRE-family HTH domain
MHDLFTFVIVNYFPMKERLLEFLRSENKSSAQLAEEIGVQPSGISHILSGRNNPSLDFVLKMLEKYRFLSTDWLLFGRGSMYKDSKMQTLFDDMSEVSVKPEGIQDSNESGAGRKEMIDETGDPTEKKTLREDIITNSAISRIVIFYRDNSFDLYSPRG